MRFFRAGVIPPWFMVVIAGMLLALLESPVKAAPKETLVPLQRHASLKGQEDLQPNNLVFSSDGKLLASIEGRNRIVRLWDVATGKSAGTLSDQQYASSVSFSPDGKTIATCGDRKIFLWDAVSRKKLTMIHAGWPVYTVRIAADGKRLTAIEKDWLVTWDIEKKEEVSSRKLTVQPVFLPAWPAMKKPAFILRPQDRYGFALVDVLSGDTVWSAKGHERPIIGYALSRDEKTIASADPFSVRLWNRDTGEHLATIEHLPDVIYSPLLRANGRNSACALSPDGKILACAYEYQVPRGQRGGGFRLYAIPSGKLLAEVPEEIGITSLVFSPDGRLLATEFRTSIELWTIPADEKKKGK